MFATSVRHSHIWRRQAPPCRALPAVLVAAAGAIVVAVVLIGSGQAALADDLADDVAASPQKTRVAAIGKETTALPDQAGAPAPASNIDLRVLLAQSAQTASTDAQSGDATILAAFALSMPHSVEEDLAKEHGLELISRTELPTLGFRVVRYRVPDQRLISTLVANLRADPRVRSAQTNVVYRPLTPTGPAKAADSRKDGPASVAKLKGEAAPGASARRRLEPKTALAPRARPQPAAQPKLAADAKAAAAVKGHSAGRALASTSHAALRFPAADEPFVNVGVQNE